MRAALPTRDRNWEIVTRKIRVMRIGETSFRLQYLKESTQTRDAYLVEFDLLRRKADGLMQNGVSFLDSSTAAVGQQSANLPNREKSSAQAGTHVALATVEIAHQMRLFFGSTRTCQKRVGQAPPWNWNRKVRRRILLIVKLRTGFTLNQNLYVES